MKKSGAPKILWLVVLGFIAFIGFKFHGAYTTEDIDYSEAIQIIQDGRVEHVSIDGEVMTLKPLEGHEKNDTFMKKKWETTTDQSHENLEKLLIDEQVAFTFVPKGIMEGSWWFLILMIWMIIMFIPIISKLNSDGNDDGPLSILKRKSRIAEEVKTRFEDVAGHTNPKHQLKEVVEFLKNPEKFGRLGARIPKGTLLFGPPGTGKTLLARAVAGEAGVPFLYMNGSDFVEMFVGVGARRVRSLFKEAREVAPCIVFIDEIDGVGGKRSSGATGGQSEHNQTINALLAEMDGFKEDDGVILIAATNRAEALDGGLTRKGRFDRKIFVGPPQQVDRESVLRVHVRDKKIGDDVDLAFIAKMTPGMVGADMENIANEAALLATADDAPCISQRHFRQAIENIIVGHKDQGRILGNEDRYAVAVHEAGHAAVAAAQGRGRDVSRISIIPTSSGALGYNLNLPEDEDDSYLQTKKDLLQQVAHLLGGRAAEQVVIGEVSTGASDDLRRANAILFRMVTVYGMGSKLKNRVFDPDSTQWSQHTKREIDQCVREMLDEMYSRALDIIRGNEQVVKGLAGQLLDREEIGGGELLLILQQITDVDGDKTNDASEAAESAS